MRLLIIGIFLATSAFRFFTMYLTYSMRNAPLPENVKDVFDAETYKKNQAYKMDNLKFSIITGVVSTIVLLAYLLVNFHFGLYNFIISYTENLILTSLFIFIVPLIISNVLSTLMDIYDTFVIEERYGFNNTTPATFIIDFFKMLLITLVIGAGLLSLFVFMYSQMGDLVFLAYFFVLVAFMVFMAFISPFLLRIIYKFTPLEEGELKEKIEALAIKTGYKLKGIYMVDASKRSTKLNAFATGFGKTKTIGLFDTLTEKMTNDEIVSILAHEIGHAKKHHILKQFPFNLVTMSIILAAAYFIVTMPEASQAFGFPYANLAFGIFVLFIMITPIMIILRIPSNIISRKFEYEADAFEKEISGKEVAISAIKKLYREDLGNLTPHPFVVMLEYSHPTLTQRVAAFERDES